MRRVMLVCLVLSLWQVAAVLAAEVSWEEIARGNTDVSAVLVQADNPRVILIGAKGGVFRSEDAGGSWRLALPLRGQRVNFLYSDPGNKNFLYAACANGLYYSANRGADWKRIYKGRNDAQSDCLAILACAENLYLGTGGGLFISRDSGRTWSKEGGKIGDSKIFALVSIADTAGRYEVYAAAVEGVFRMGSVEKTWERVFSPSAQEAPSGVCDDDQDKEGDERATNIRYLALSTFSAPCLYLSTSRGVYASMDKGKSWDALVDYGLLSRDAGYILATPSGELYVTTSSGIFKYTGQRWQELSFALSTGEYRALAIDKEGNLYAACDKGLFRCLRRDFAAYQPQEAISQHLAKEPDVQEVQKAAIKYAEVCPEKIKIWRRQAMACALLPTLSATVNRDAGDLWHWESGSSTKAGDDVLIKGRDSMGWDVHVSWDLGQVIWNPDQTSIDVRSKLMVELRNDILDEVNKIYFERLRVKMELDELRIDDKRKRMEKELRLKELTASLDAYTGGYFSRHIKT